MPPSDDHVFRVPGNQSSGHAAPVAGPAGAPRKGLRRNPGGWLQDLAALGSIGVAVAVVGLLAWRWHEARIPEMVVITPPPAAQVMVISNRKIFPSDGSRLELNVGAQVGVEFTERERVVRLGRGEVHCTVAKDAARPFVVLAGGVEVRAVGTIFSVRWDGGAVEILVTEGIVEVSEPAVTERAGPRDEADRAGRHRLRAGQRGVVILGGAANPGWQERTLTEAEMKTALEWRGLRLKFNGSPIARAAEEFNRLNAVQVVVDRSVAELPVTATFAVEDVAGFVAWVEHTWGAVVQRRADGSLSLRKAL